MSVKTTTPAAAAQTAQTAADKAKARAAAAAAKRAASGTKKGKPSTLKDIDGTGNVAVMEAYGDGTRNWFRKGETHTIWYLGETVHGMTELDCSFDATRRDVQVWGEIDGEHKLRAVVTDVDSTREALGKLGFTTELS